MKGRIKTFVVGCALAVQLMTPAVGHADQGASAPVVNHDIGKWANLLNHFEGALHSSGPVSTGVAAWKTAIARMKSLPAKQQIEEVNDLLNAVPYVDDQQQFGFNGYWNATPERFLSEGGDCKDYALAKYASLRALGFSPEQLRITVVIDQARNIPHAILIVNNTYVLDNQSQDVVSTSDIGRYQKLFSLNSRGWRREVG